MGELAPPLPRRPVSSLEIGVGRVPIRDASMRLASARVVDRAESQPCLRGRSVIAGSSPAEADACRSAAASLPVAARSAGVGVARQQVAQRKLHGSGDADLFGVEWLGAGLSVLHGGEERLELATRRSVRLGQSKPVQQQVPGQRNVPLVARGVGRQQARRVGCCAFQVGARGVAHAQRDLDFGEARHGQRPGSPATRCCCCPQRNQGLEAS